MNKSSAIYTEKNNCQDCYKCVKNCPVKAIKLEDGSASVIPELCIFCGKCTQVCPANAKKVRDDIPTVRATLSKEKIIVSLAPSYLSEYNNEDIHNVIAAFHEAGFYGVSETALGAEKVALETKNWLDEQENGVFLSSCCPSAVLLVKKYYPQYSSSIAPVLSPMVAHAKFLKTIYPDAKVLFVGPCVAAPLAGALIYISQSGDALLGGSALFVMSLGMGAPLLLIGTTAGRYMPRPGMWMQNITAFFGVMLLGVAIWMLSRIIPSFVSMALWAVLIISSSIYFGALESFHEHTKGWQKILKSLLFMALVYGVVLLVGFLSGATNPLAPFEKFTAKENVAVSASSTTFNKIKTIDELNLALKNAQKPVMLDFYADWCVNCVEFEQFTFSDARVKAKLEKLTLLKADVTKNSEDDKALQKAFNIYGPPAILFFKEGKEISALRLVGFKNADEFLIHLEKLGL